MCRQHSLELRARLRAHLYSNKVVDSTCIFVPESVVTSLSSFISKESKKSPLRWTPDKSCVCFKRLVNFFNDSHDLWVDVKEGSDSFLCFFEDGFHWGIIIIST